MSWRFWATELAIGAGLTCLGMMYPEQLPQFALIGGVFILLIAILWPRGVSLIDIGRNKNEWDWLRQEAPDCTLSDLVDYLNAQIGTVPARLEVEAKILFGFRLVSEFLSQKLFEGKIKAWGKETRENRVSGKEKLIPQGYWEFNRLNLDFEEFEDSFEKNEIKTYSTKEIMYSSLRFNQKQVIEQIEFFFSKP